jgi:superfamily II DNA or RNA helicase
MRGIWNMATNSGKGAACGALVKMIGLNALIVVDKVEVFNAVLAELKRGFRPSDIGIVKSGKAEFGFVTLAMAKSLQNLLKSSVNARRWLESVEVLMVDEAHHAGSDSYLDMLNMCNAYVRVLMSGTVLDSESKIKNMRIKGLSGKVLCTISNADLMDDGVSQIPNIKVFDAGGEDWFDYDEEVHFTIHNNTAVYQQIAEGLVADPKITLIAVGIKAGHGKKLYKYLRKNCDGLRIEYVDADDPFRPEKIKDFIAGVIDVLISTVGKEGMNAACIRRLVVAHGGKSKIMIKQIAGRAIRHDGVNDDVEFWDFWHRGWYLSKHSRKRMKIYKEEGWKVQFMYKARKDGTPID